MLYCLKFQIVGMPFNSYPQSSSVRTPSRLLRALPLFKDGEPEGALAVEELPIAVSKVLLEESPQLLATEPCRHDIVVFIEYEECRNTSYIVQAHNFAVPALER